MMYHNKLPQNDCYPESRKKLKIKNHYSVSNGYTYMPKGWIMICLFICFSIYYPVSKELHCCILVISRSNDKYFSILM